MTIEEFQIALQAKVRAAYAETGPALIPTILLMRGPRYTRIVRSLVVDGETIERSAYGFIENDSGRLLKADGWKSPAKGARGNLADADPLARCSQFSIR